MQSDRGRPSIAALPYPCPELFPEAQLLDERPVSFQVCQLEVFKEPAATSDHPKQTVSTVVVGLVLVEVHPQMIDPLSEQGDLYRSASVIPIVDLVLLDKSPSFNRRYARHSVRCCLRKSPLLQGKPSVSSRNESRPGSPARCIPLPQ